MLGYKGQDPVVLISSGYLGIGTCYFLDFLRSLEENELDSLSQTTRIQLKIG